MRWRRGFADPPAESRPRTWWNWMDNNISRAGITKDLEAMGPTSKIRSDLILEVFRKVDCQASLPSSRESSKMYRILMDA